MFYDNSFWGMNLLWWAFWTLLLLWIFATPYNIPFQQKKRGSALHLLNKRFADGEITSEEYHEMKRIIQNGLS